MKLLMNTSPYRLEQGYELGFGTSVYDIMAEVILAFQNPNDDILFSYANWDKDLDPYKEYLIEDSAHYFHSDVIYDPEQIISQKVKNVLLLHYAPESDPNVSFALMDQLMANFKEAPLNELNEELLRKIGTVVYEMQMINTLEDRGETTQAFVNSRLVDSNAVLPRLQDLLGDKLEIVG